MGRICWLDILSACEKRDIQDFMTKFVGQTED